MKVAPTLNLNFAQARFPDPRIDFSRPTTATYTDALGRIRTAAANVPRFDFDPATGESRGLLVEESRTNLLRWSQDFSNAVWHKANCTIIQNAATAPDGTLSAAKLVPTTTTNSHYVTQNTAVAANTTYHRSIYVKAAGYKQASIRTAAGRWSDGGSSGYLDLETGALSGANADKLTVERLPDGWWRVSSNQTADGSGTAGGMLILPAVNDTINFAGDGTSGLYIWGAQLEQGNFPTSYIPTLDAPVTRVVDNAVIPLDAFPVDPRGFTVLIDIATFSGGVVNPAIFALEDAGGTGSRNSVFCYTTTAGFAFVAEDAAGSIGAIYNAGSLSKSRVALSVAGSQMIWAVGGQTGTVPLARGLPDLTGGRLRLGDHRSSALSPHRVVFRAVHALPRPLDAATLQRLTEVPA